MKELIKEFLTKFAVKVSADEDLATTELMMDNHTCIEFEDQQYYVQKDCSFYTEDDDLLKDFLVYTYGL